MLPPNIPKGPETTCAQQDALYHGICLIHELTMIPEVVKDRKTSLFYNNNIFGTGVSDKPTPAPMLFNSLKIIWRAVVNNLVQLGPQSESKKNPLSFTVTYDFFEALERIKTLMLCLLQFYKNERADFSAAVLFDIIHIMTYDFSGYGGRSNEGNKDAPSSSDTNDVGGSYSMSHFSTKMIEHFRSYVPDLLQDFIAEMVAESTSLDHSVAYCAQCKINSILKTYFLLLSNYGHTIPSQDVDSDESRKKLHYYDMACAYSYEFKTICMQVLIIPLIHQLVKQRIAVYAEPKGDPAPSDGQVLSHYESYYIDSEILRLIVVNTLSGQLGHCESVSLSKTAAPANSGEEDSVGFGNELNPPLGNSGGFSNSNTGALRIELLKLTTILIQHNSLQLVKFRKELIKFAWNHLKSDEMMIRHTAYISMCAFITAYETPPKIILQVYVALLRAYLHEYNEMMKLALDMLLTALPSRLRSDDFAKAMKWSKKIMLDELYSSGAHASSSGKRRGGSGSMSAYADANSSTANVYKQLQLWQIVMRHPVVFYNYRSYFVAQMINTITILGGIMYPSQQQRTASSSIEEEQRRQVALGIADLLVGWELYRSHKSKQATGDGATKEKEDGTANLQKADEVGKSELVEVRSAKRVRLNHDGDSLGVTWASNVPPTETSADASLSEANVPKTSASALEEFTLQPNMIQLLGNFVIKLGLLEAGVGSSSGASKSSGSDNGVSNGESLSGIISAQCLNIFRHLVSLLPMKNIRLSQFDKVLRSLLDSYAAYYRSKLNAVAAASGGKSVQAPPISHQPSSRSLKLVLEYLCASIDCCTHNPDLLLHSSNVSIITELLPYVLVNKSALVVTELRHVLSKMASLCPLKCPRTIGERTSFTNAAAQDSESNNKAMIRDYYYPRMNLLLDNMIIKAADKVTAMYRSQQSNDANSAHNSKVYPATPQQFLDSCPAWHILLILDDLTGGAGNAKGGAPKMGSDPSWGIMHGSALMKLAQSLLHYHYDSINIQLRSGPMQIVTSLAEHGQYVVHTKTEEEMYPTYDIRVLFDEVVNGHVSKQSTVHSAPAKVSDGFLAPVASTATPVTPWSNSASIADSISLDANTVSLCLCLVILGRITIQSIDAQNSGPPNNAMELHIDAVVHMLLSTLEHSDHPFVVYISCSLLQKMRLIEKQGSKDKRSESLLVILNRMDERIIVNNIKSLGRFRNELLAVPVYVRSIILYESLCSTLNMREATSSALVPLAGLQCYSYPVLKRYIQKKYGISSGETNSVDKFSETVIRVIKSGSNDCTTSKSRYWPVLLSTLLLQYGFKNENENCNLFVSNMEQLCLVDLSVSDNIWQQYIEWCWKRIVGSCDHTKKSTLMPDDESCRKWLNLCSSIYENVSRGEYIQKLTVFNEDRNLYVCCGNDATTTACNSNSCIVGSNLVMSMYNKLLYNLPWRFNPPAPTSVAEGLLRPFFHKLLGMRQSSSDMHFKHVEVAGDRYGMLADGCWFPPEFIAAVGSRFRMHAVTNSVLECMIHANAHAVDPKCAGGEEEISNSTLLKPVNAWTSVLQYNSTKAVNLLLSSYEELHDDDMTLALNRLMIAQDSKPSFCHGINMNTVLENAIHLESLGKYEYAQKFLHLYMILVERQEQYVSSDPSSLSGEASLLNYEICGKRWMKCAKQLTQWNVLYDHSKSTNVPDMEAAAMMEDWDLVKKYRCFPSTVALLEQGSTSTKLYDGMLAVMNSKFPDADRACAQAVQMSLMEWENLPSALHAGSNAHKSLLHTFHRIIEIRESAGMVIQAKENAEKELKGMIKLWRSRLPDGNDKYYVWDNVLKWRLHVYNAIGNMLATYRSSDTEDPEKKQEEEAAMASLHDIPNATVRLTKAARHHKLYPTSLSTISKLDTVTTMDIDNAFAKVREHMACYLYVNTTTSVKLTVPPSAAPVAGSSYIMPPSMREQANYIRQQRQCGLNMITNTNVSYFGNTQQAEVYRLRGVFHVQLGSLNDAQKAYAESVQTSPTYSKTWLSWGVLCDYIASSQSTDSMSDASQLNLYSTVMIAILKAICYNGHSTSNASSQQVDICHSDGSTVSITSPAPVSTTITNTSQTKALTLLPHLIWLCIKFADSKVSDPEHLCKLLVSHSSSLPAWIWMPYVDVLMNVVAHSVAGSHIMKILERVCIAYPQVILPTLMGNSLKNTMQKYSMMPQFFHMGSPLHQKSARCESLIQNFIAKKIPTYYYKYSLFSSTMINSFEVTPVMQLYALLHRMITYNFVDNTDFTIGDDKLASECVPAHVIPDLVDGMVDLLYVGIGTGERSNGQPSYRLRNPFAGTTDIASEHESIGINTEDLSKNSLSSPAKKGAGRGAGKGKPAKKQRDAIAKEDAVTTLDSVESDFFSPSMSSTQLFGDLLSEYGISEVVSVATASTPTRKSGKLAVESDKLKPVLDGSTVQYSVIANIKESMISHLKVLSSWKLLMLLRKWVLIACKYANDAECDGKNSNIQGCEVQRATEDMFTESYYYYKPNKSLDGEHGSSSRSGNSIILDLSLDKNINIPGAYYHYHHQHSSSSNINSTGSPSSNNLMVESLSGSTTSTSSNSGSNATKLVKMLPCRMKSSLSSCFKNNQWHREVSFLGNDGHVYYYDVLMRDGSDRAPASHDSEMKWSSLCKYVDEIVIKSDKLSRGRDLCVPHSPILLLGTFQSVSDSGLVAFGAAMPRSSSLSLMCRGDSSSNNLNNSSNCQSMKEILEKYLIRNNFSSAMDKVVGEENVHFGTSVMLDYLIYVRLHCDHSMTNIPFMSLPNNILVGYVCERCSSFEKYVEFKKLIAYQMGMYAAINTLVASGCCGEDNGVMPNLDQIIFSVTNGKIFMLPPPFVDNIQNRPKNSASFSIFSLSSSDKQLLTVDSIKNQSMSCATSFRLTSNLLGLLSPGGIVATSGCGALILGGVCPGFNCVVEAMTNEYEIYSKSLLRLYLVESRRDVDTTDTSLVLSIECIEVCAHLNALIFLLMCNISFLTM